MVLAYCVLRLVFQYIDAWESAVMICHAVACANHTDSRMDHGHTASELQLHRNINTSGTVHAMQCRRLMPLHVVTARSMGVEWLWCFEGVLC